VSSGPPRDQRDTAAVGHALGDATSESVEAVSLVVTGQLGEVMRESARAAVTVALGGVARSAMSRVRGPVEAHVRVPAGPGLEEHGSMRRPH